MTSVAMTGYASLDYVVRLDRTPVADTTATILSRPLDWPRLGDRRLTSPARWSPRASMRRR